MSEILNQAMMISAAGLRAQSVRMRVISENLANQDSIAPNAGEDPYRRKVVTFTNEVNKVLGINAVKVTKVTFDMSEVGSRFDPGHPAADKDGYITTSNVKGIIEMMDMRQAQRSYEANITAIEASRAMLMQTLDLLR